MGNLNEKFLRASGVLLLVHVIIAPLELIENQHLQNIPLVVSMLLFSISCLWELLNSKKANRSILSITLLFGLCIIWTLFGFFYRGDSISTFVMGSVNRGDGIFFYILLPLFLCSSLWLNRNHKQGLSNFVFYSYAIVVLVGVIQLFNSNLFNPFAYDGIVGIFANTNSAGAFYCIVGVAQLLIAQRQKLGIFSKIQMMVAVIGITLGLLSKTLQAPILLLIIGGMFSIGKIWILLKNRFFKHHQLAILRMFSVAGIGLLVVIVSIWILPLMSKVQTFRFRQYYWDSAIATIKDNWLFGIGPGNFARHVSEFRSFDYVEQLGPNLRVDDPHNFFLNLVLVMGVPALFVILISLVKLIQIAKNQESIVRVGNQVNMPLLVAFILYLNISYTAPSVIVFSLLSISLLGKDNYQLKHGNPDYSKVWLSSTFAISIFIVGISLLAVSYSVIPSKMTFNEASSYLRNDDLRCEVRTEILSQLVNSDYRIENKEIEKFYDTDVRCSAVSFGIMRYFILNEIVQDESRVGQFYEYDPKNPNVVLLAALASKENGNLYELARYQTQVSKMPAIILEYLDKSIREVYLKEIGSLPS